MDSNFSIRLQAFDGAGNKTGGEIVVNTTTTGSQFEPSIAALPDGRVVVTWTDNSHSGGDASGNAIRMQIIAHATASLPAHRRMRRCTATISSMTRSAPARAMMFCTACAATTRCTAVTATIASSVAPAPDYLYAGLGDDILTGGNATVTTWAFMGGLDKLADFNGDGTTDIVEIATNQQAKIWLSSSTGLLDYTLWGTGFLQSDKTGDFNGDGKADLIQLFDANHTPMCGCPTATASSLYCLGHSGYLERQGRRLQRRRQGRCHPVCRRQPHRLCLALQAATAFGAYTLWGTGVTSNDKIGDFNGDGKDDLIQLYDGTHTAYVWLTNAGLLSMPRRSGARASPRRTRSATSTATARTTSSNCSTAITTPMSGCRTAPLSSAPTVWGSGVTSSDRIGDFNGDGKDDIIQLFDGNHNAYVWLSNGTSFTGPTVWGHGVTSNDQIGDFNGDGKDDLIQLMTATATPTFNFRRNEL